MKDVMNKEVIDEENKEIEIRETQGQKKVRQYVDDLLRNKYFTLTIKKLLSAGTKVKNSKDDTDKLYEIIKEYRKLDAKVRKHKRQHFAEYNKLRNILAEEYGLDNDLLRPVLMTHSSLRDGDFKDSLLYDPLQTDLCFLADNYDENLNPVYPPMPLAMDTRKQDHLKAFPVSIDIHRFATKRDVLDYIEKRWPWIENILGVYKDYKKIRFRERKHSRKLVDFIWSNRKLKVNELRELLDKNFPDNGLVYYELHKIIFLEKQRRNKKINVGQ